MTPANDYLDLTKTADAFAKFMPKEFVNNDAAKAFTTAAAKANKAGLEAVNESLDLTVSWMKDGMKNLETLMETEGDIEAYSKKAGDVVTQTYQTLPSRLFAYAELAQKSQLAMMEAFMGAAKQSAPAPRKKAAAKA